jgi:hypothetical protein
LEKNLSVETKQCVEALTQPDLESDAEEVGMEDRHPTTIVNFCRKAMGIYEFQLSVENLEELGCTPKEVRLVLSTCDMEHKSNTMYANSLGGGYWVHSIR